MHEAMIQSLTTQFEKRFNRKKGHIMFTPGRINILGHHSDYVPGHLLATTINRGAYVMCHLRDDQEVHFYCSKSHTNKEAIFTIDDTEISAEASWTDYLKVIIQSLNQLSDFIHQGMDILLDWNLPFGAGLATESAIISILTMSLAYTYDIDLTDDEIGQVAYNAEQTLTREATAKGKKADYATHLKAHKDYTLYYSAITEETELIPAFKRNGYSILLIDTLRNRQFNQMRYQRRIKECETVLTKFKEKLPIQQLTDLSLSEFERYRYLINNPRLENRAKYVVYEHDRVSRAKEALRNKNVELFNALINRSYESLRDLFELTGYELDTIVEAANYLPGVLSVNATDGRMGGSAFAIVETAAIDAIKKELTKISQEEIGLAPEFETTWFGDRSRILM